MKGLLFDIYRGTTHDGPGMRSTAFFMGCPLSCRWCHNPEGISADRQVWWNSSACIGCGLCEAACPHGALQGREGQGVVIERPVCRSCGGCVAACPSGAMSFTGEFWELDALTRELLRDQAYYRRSKGGVTASGGEALLQCEFVAELFRRLHESGVHTALDTCGFADRQALEAVLPHTDCVLYDLKFLSSTQHKAFTGVDNDLILENLLWLAGEAGASAPRELWIRTPLIPGATASEKNLSEMGRFLHRHVPGLARWELCTFNNSCAAKYRRLNLEWQYEDAPLLDEEEVAALRAAAERGGVAPDRIVVSGIVAQTGVDA